MLTPIILQVPGGTLLLTLMMSEPPLLRSGSMVRTICCYQLSAQVRGLNFMVNTALWLFRSVANVLEPTTAQVCDPLRYYTHTIYLFIDV